MKITEIGIKEQHSYCNNIIYFEMLSVNLSGPFVFLHPVIFKKIIFQEAQKKTTNQQKSL